MNDHDLDAALRDKYAQRAQRTAPPQLARRVLAVPANSPTRRGRLPWRQSGGMNIMLSATKMAAAVAIIALAGAFLLEGALGPSGVEPEPGSASADVDLSARPVSGTVTITESELDPVNIGNSLFEWTSDPSGLLWESDDARLSGAGSMVEHGVQHTQTYTGLRTSLWTVDNEAGSWTGDGSGYASPRGGREFIVLTGDGDYHGLSAYLTIIDGDGPETPEGSPLVFEGVVFPGPPPTSPEAAD